MPASSTNRSFQSAKPGLNSIIPAPARISLRDGYLQLGPGSPIYGPESRPDFQAPVRALREFLGKKGNTEEPDSGHAPIRLSIDPRMEAEAYSLEIDKARITITSVDPEGAFYGIQSLIQLAAPWRTGANSTSIEVPCASVRDKPAFPYRGLHLDVGRHLFPVAFIKQYIDLLARYKMNRFHWHLTEDQGWRIEIRKYPRLQEISAYRKETLIGHLKDEPAKYDGQPYGGFYTQEEIREVVQYAQDRCVTIIPEIEMPGHAQAAIAAYPELGCTGEPMEVCTKWGIIENVYCPSETTFEFLENVLTEVMELFPSEYIHIGGDECPKEQWKSNATCKQIIREHNLRDEDHLQSWFIQRIERFLNRNGRKLIGWDEILEGGLAPNATVMSWRGEKGGIEAARMGHDIIMTPTDFCYFDSYQFKRPNEPLAIGGLIPLEKVYSYNPVPNVLTAAQSGHVLGAQGNVWTEYMKTQAQVEYMVYPRMQALAEVVWSGSKRPGFDDFLARLGPHIKWMIAEGMQPADPFQTA
jgi:hexosaminidase